MITKEEENLVIDKILTGDKQSYARLVDHYKKYAFTIAFKIVENRPEAEEVAQDSFIKAFQYLHTFNRQARFSTWLYRIVFNTAISYKRKNRQRFQSIENSLIQYDQGASDDTENKEKSAFIIAAMQKLNNLDRIALQLYYLNELSLEEVAEMMSMNGNTLKVRVHRARQRLGEELTKLLKEEALTL